MRKKLKIIWDDEAKKSLRHIFVYIKDRESVAQAIKVRKKIAEQARALVLFPEKFVEEPNLKSERGNYRFKAIWSYKIIYEVTPEAIFVLDIFHTSRDPNMINRLVAD